VLSQRECKILFKTPSNLKHRVILSLIYSAGLRISEATALLISDIDFDRKTITVRKGKGNKDRCLPLATALIIGLNKYLIRYQPNSFLFYSYQNNLRYSTRSIQQIMSAALQKALINKPGASVHSLRHSFATHLLENGANIVQIQGLMGHNDITTTLIYTKLVNQNLHAVKSPFDTLYGL
jgi:integrase/recombinase XerD